MCCQGDQHAHRLHARHRCKHLIEIHPLSLSIAFCNQTSFVLDNVTFWIFLYLEDPLELDGSVSHWECSELPRGVLLDGTHLIHHGASPARLPECLLDACGLLGGQHAEAAVVDLMDRCRVVDI